MLRSVHFSASVGVAIAVFSGAALAEERLDLKSQVPGLEIVALADLPAAPGDAGDREACKFDLLEAVTTTAGKAVAAKGWGVTAEKSFGAWTAVSFLGGCEPGTSGSTLFTDGNVGFYEGDQLVALIYASDDEALPIGRVESRGADGLRLWSGDWLPQPMADIGRVGQTGIGVVEPSGNEVVCGGAGRVPYVYGMPIDKARTVLAEAGWEPSVGDAPEPGTFVASFVAAGVPEVDDCSGTGFGFCRFDYTGPAGLLGVTTAGEGGENGELPSVVGFGVDCALQP